jgi:hypothetical protein
MNITKLISDLDCKISAEQKLEANRNLQLTMFLIENKYNLDILAAIKLDNELLDSHDSQLRQVINLLSSDALSNLLKQGAFRSDSVIMAYIYKSWKNISWFSSENKDEIISEHDTLIFNIYKRIEVLKTLASIEPPYTAMKQLNFRTRLKNLNDVLLAINSKIQL